MTFVWGPGKVRMLTYIWHYGHGIVEPDMSNMHNISFEGKMERDKHTLPNHKRKLDTLRILIVSQLHPHIRVRSFVVAQALRHLCNVPRACAREFQVI